jgi:hypothetical protein
VTFTLTEYQIPSSAIITPDEFILRPWHEPDPRNLMFPGWPVVLSAVEYLVVLGALGYGGAVWWRGGLGRGHRDFLAMAIAAAVIQAVIGGVFSEPSSRYEARVIWLIPLAATLIAVRLRRPMVACVS